MKKPQEKYVRPFVLVLEVVVALNRVLRDYTPPERAWVFALGGVVLEEALAVIKGQAQKE